MDISEACRVFGVNNLELVTEDALKARYRKLATMYHPDNGYDSSYMIKINEAKDELNKFLDKKTQRKRIITLGEYIKLKKENVSVENKLVNCTLSIRISNCLDQVEECTKDLVFIAKDKEIRHEFKVGVISDLFVNGIEQDVRLSLMGNELKAMIKCRECSFEFRIENERYIVHIRFSNEH